MSTRALRIAPWAVAIAVAAVLACGDDPADDGSPNPEQTSPEPRPDGSDLDAPASDGGPIDPPRSQWQLLPELPSDVTRSGAQCTVAVDAEDRVLVAYGESASGYTGPHSVPVFRQEGSAWTMLGGTPLVSEASMAGWPRLAVAKDGTIYVAYVHDDGVKVQRFSGGAWSALPAPPFADTFALVVDADGSPVLVGRKAGEPGTLVRFDGATWSTPTSPTVTAPGALAGVLSAAPLPDGNVAALVRTSSSNLKPFTLSGTTWTPLGAELADRAQFPMLASSPGGALAAAWSSDDNVFAARFDPTSNAFTPLGGALGQPGARYAVVALDSAGTPYVAWREGTTGVAISVFAGGAWSALPSPAPGNRGTLPVIALDRRDLPVICWEEGREAGGSSVVRVARVVSE